MRDVALIAIAAFVVIVCVGSLIWAYSTNGIDSRYKQIFGINPPDDSGYDEAEARVVTAMLSRLYETCGTVTGIVNKLNNDYKSGLISAGQLHAIREREAVAIGNLNEALQLAKIYDRQGVIDLDVFSI